MLYKGRSNQISTRMGFEPMFQIQSLLLGFCYHSLNSISGQKLLGMGSWFRTLCPSGFRNALRPSWAYQPTVLLVEITLRKRLLVKGQTVAIREGADQALRQGPLPRIMLFARIRHVFGFLPFLPIMVALFILSWNYNHFSKPTYKECQ